MTILLDADATVQPGQVLGGKYRVESVLGMGGMGVVVAARHVELDTRFALKLMRRDGANAEAVERFLREARAAVKLKSEHCVRVVDVGKLESGAPYMVMELLVGRDLAELVRENGARAPAEAVDYILQSCEGLAEAHALGIVHRDIKPQNLFLTRGVDGMPLVKVLDFGLAKSVAMTPGLRALTHSAAVMGSPMYMSPEQMRASRDVDARSDLWALGVCLYELLTARAPFEGATYPELCSAVLNKPPAPMPSDVPRGLSRVIARCLHKDRRRRFGTVAELADALEEFASARGAAARIRAVLEAPREQLDSLPPPPAHDPTADTETAASIDTTKRRAGVKSGRFRSWRRAPKLRLFAIVGGAAGGLAVALVLQSIVRTPPPAVSVSVAVAAPMEQPAVPTRATSAQVPTPLAPVASVTAAAPEPAPPAPSATTALEPMAAKPARARGTAGRRAPKGAAAGPAASAAPAPPRPAPPILAPKTTEF